MDEVVLGVGDTFTAATEVIPSYKSAPNYTLTSDDTAIASVSGSAVNALSTGSATVSMSANGTFSDDFDVIVKNISYPNLSSSRTATDITLARYPTSIEVGEEYSLQAYVLSDVTSSHPCKYQYSEDNLVYFTSSDTSIARVKNGVLFGVAVGTTTITAHDLANTVTKSFTVTVTLPEGLTYTSGEVYEVSSIDTTDEESTTTGIIAALAYAFENNYKKIVFPNGIYYVSPVYGTIDIPTRMIVDFNDSIIQIESSAMSSSGYDMFRFQNTEYSKLINATIYGERFLLSQDGSGNDISVAFIGTNYKSGIENCTISNSPGYNINVRFSNRKIAGVRYSYIEAGGLDANGDPVSASYSYRTNEYVNISTIGDWFGLGNMQGYQGYLYMSARVYDICFYDENKGFISKLSDCVQYYHYPKPSGAKYAKIAYNWGEAPSSYDPDFGSIAHIYSMDVSVNCFIRRCVIENCNTAGTVPNIGDGFLIEDCLYKDNGFVLTKCQIDWEDGRNNIKGHVVRNCRFVDGGAVMIVGGDGIAIHNNVFERCQLRVDSEAQNSRVWLNQFIGSKITTITTKTDMVFSQNIGVHGASYTTTNPSNVDFAVRETENDFGS